MGLNAHPVGRVVAAAEFDRLSPGVFIWHVFDPAVKAELFSTAFLTNGGIYIVDPIPLRDEALSEIAATDKVAGLIVTNENHHRASRQFAERFGVSVWTRAENSDDDVKIDNEIQIVAIDGAAPGEVALCVRGSLIIGDALINFPPYGFTFLPAKYCDNAKVMRRSLGKLLELDFERMLFAHGEPILVNARERLARLLNDAK